MNMFYNGPNGSSPYPVSPLAFALSNLGQAYGQAQQLKLLREQQAAEKQQREWAQKMQEWQMEQAQQQQAASKRDYYVNLYGPRGAAMAAPEVFEQAGTPLPSAGIAGAPQAKMLPNAPEKPFEQKTVLEIFGRNVPEFSGLDNIPYGQLTQEQKNMLGVPKSMEQKTLAELGIQLPKGYEGYASVRYGDLSPDERKALLGPQAAQESTITAGDLYSSFGIDTTNWAPALLNKPIKIDFTAINELSKRVQQGDQVPWDTYFTVAGLPTPPELQGRLVTPDTANKITTTASQLTGARKNVSEIANLDARTITEQLRQQGMQIENETAQALQPFVISGKQLENQQMQASIENLNQAVVNAKQDAVLKGQQITLNDLLRTPTVQRAYADLLATQANTRLTEARTQLTSAQTLTEAARKVGFDIDNRTSELLQPFQINEAQLKNENLVKALRQMDAQIRNLDARTSTEEAMRDPNIQLAYANVLRAQADTALTQEQTATEAVKRQGMELDNRTAQLLQPYQIKAADLNNQRVLAAIQEADAAIRNLDARTTTEEAMRDPNVQLALQKVQQAKAETALTQQETTKLATFNEGYANRLEQEATKNGLDIQTARKNLVVMDKELQMKDAQIQKVAEEVLASQQGRQINWGRYEMDKQAFALEQEKKGIDLQFAKDTYDAAVAQKVAESQMAQTRARYLDDREQSELALLAVQAKLDGAEYDKLVKTTDLIAGQLKAQIDNIYSTIGDRQEAARRAQVTLDDTLRNSALTRDYTLEQLTQLKALFRPKLEQMEAQSRLYRAQATNQETENRFQPLQIQTSLANQESQTELNEARAQEIETKLPLWIEQAQADLDGTKLENIMTAEQLTAFKQQWPEQLRLVQTQIAEKTAGIENDAKRIALAQRTANAQIDKWAADMNLTFEQTRQLKDLLPLKREQLQAAIEGDRARTGDIAFQQGLAVDRLKQDYDLRSRGLNIEQQNADTAAGNLELGQRRQTWAEEQGKAELILAQAAQKIKEGDLALSQRQVALAEQKANNEQINESIGQIETALERVFSAEMPKAGRVAIKEYNAQVTNFRKQYPQAYLQFNRLDETASQELISGIAEGRPLTQWQQFQKAFMTTQDSREAQEAAKRLELTEAQIKLEYTRLEKEENSKTTLQDLKVKMIQDAGGVENLTPEQAAFVYGKSPDDAAALVKTALGMLQGNLAYMQMVLEGDIPGQKKLVAQTMQTIMEFKDDPNAAVSKYLGEKTTDTGTPDPEVTKKNILRKVWDAITGRGEPAEVANQNPVNTSAAPSSQPQSYTGDLNGYVTEIRSMFGGNDAAALAFIKDKKNEFDPADYNWLISQLEKPKGPMTDEEVNQFINDYLWGEQAGGTVKMLKE